MPEQTHGTRARHSNARQVFYIVFLFVAAIFVYAIAYKGVRFFRVPSGSMLPTLEPGDYIITMPQHEYHRGDIVVLRDPLEKSAFLVKRIVAVAGDTADIGLGRLSIDGHYASEPYIREPMNYALAPMTIPADSVLVLGDNRNESDDASRWLIDPDTGKAMDATNTQSDMIDGRRWTRAVPTSTIIGKVRCRYLPVARFGPVASFPLTNSEGE